MGKRLATRLAAVSLTIALPLTGLSAVQAEEISTPAAVSANAVSAPSTTYDPAADSIVQPGAPVSDGADEELVQPTALPAVPWFIAKCIGGIGLNFGQIGRLLELSLTGDYAAMTAAFGKTVTSCIRGR